MKISDRAIADRSDDILGRWGIAKTIYDLITATQKDSALRVGVYGSWGEGKTSVLRFVETLAVKARIPLCWFSVWSAQTQSDLWGGLYDALTPLAQESDKQGLFKSFTRKAAAKTEGLANINQYTKAAHSLAKLAKVGPDDAKRVITSLAASGRVLILVDDVDRVDAALVPKLLMGLHDLLDELGRCAFVIALDPAIVSGGLSQLNPAWSSAPAFLEKIVQYPFRLPRPTAEQLQRLALEALKESHLSVPQQAVLDVLDLLPPNPRKVKQFIRSLQRLQPTLSRFGNDEWNPTLLLLLDLLRTVSAEAAEELLQDEKFVQELVLGMVFRRKEDMHEGDKITKEQFARIGMAVANAMPRASEGERAPLVEQIIEIASAATERLALIGPDDAMRHARLDHEPPVMTLREFDKIVEAWRGDTSSATLTALLSEHAARIERSESDVLEACVLSLLSRRAELIAHTFEAFDRTEAGRLVERIEMHSSLLEHLIVDHDVLGDARIASRVTIFLTMRTQVAEFTNRLDYAPYVPVREALREQMYRASAYLRDRAADVLKDLKPWDRFDLDRGAAGGAVLKETRERLFRIFSEFLCESTLQRFRRPGGVASLGNFSRSPAETWLLMSAGTAFHGSECRARLLSIAQERDEAVSQNFFVYLEMLVGDAGFTSSALAADATLVIPAWRAASRVRPQPTMQGRVVELVSRLRAALNDDASIPMPSWIEPNQEKKSPSATGTNEQKDTDNVE